jgi:hypothetical protein
MLASQDRLKPALRTGSQARRPRYFIQRLDLASSSRCAHPKKIRIFPLDFDFRAGMILSLCLTGACRKGVPEGAPGDRKTCGKNLQKKG